MDETFSHEEEQTPPKDSFSRNGQSLGGLIVEITQDISTLIRKEVELAKSELTEVVRAKAISAGLYAIGGLLAMLVIPFVLLTIYEVLKIWLPGWGAALIITSSTAVLAIGIFAVARKKFSQKLKPEETIRTLKEDVEWAKSLKR